MPVEQSQAQPQIPFDARLVDPKKEKIDTPVDDRGLVDVTKLIESVKATVHPDFEWPTSLREPDEHHFYWYKSLYPSEVDGESTNLAIFKGLPIHKGLVPRTFHDWLHQVTIPPEVPEPEVIEYRIEAWDVAATLFQGIQNQRSRIVRRFKRDYKNDSEFMDEDTINQRMINQIAEDNFPTWHRNIERLRLLPPDFRLISPNETPVVLMNELAKIVSRNNLYLVPSS